MKRNNNNYHLKITVFILSYFVVYSVAYSSNSTFFSHEVGGKNGMPFVEMAAPHGVISGLNIRSGGRIDNIQLTYHYKNKYYIKGKQHGGYGGKLKTFKLKKGEYITEVGGTYGKYITSIYVRTSKGRFERWGGKGGKPFSHRASKRSPIIGFYGSEGSLIDRLGVIRKSIKHKPNSISFNNNIKTFKPDTKRHADVGGSCDRCDSMTNPIYPFNTERDVEFWTKQNKNLSKIVNKLAGSKNKYDTYINDVEKKHCDGLIFCEIDTRVDLITKIMGVK